MFSFFIMRIVNIHPCHIILQILGISLCIYICLTSLESAIILLCTMADCKFSYTVGNIKHIPLKDLNCIECNKAIIM